MAGGEGSTFGKYFLLKKIAAGGMGEIFLAKLKGPVGFEKLLVIKRVLAQHVENQEFVEMFFAEARLAAQLTHSNIVQIYEMGEIDDAYFIAMEYVHGKSLRDLIDKARDRGETIHPQYAIDIISRLCAGMGYAHNARDLAGTSIGIIHRDINPHNLLVAYSGEVKIIDFGIAKSEMSMHKTETGTIKGKFVYMSPEQSAADNLDKRSDIFAIGICLYETLTFTNPFAKANIVLSLDAIQRKDPPPLSEFNPKLAPFEPIIRKALAKKVQDRYRDAEEMREDLQRLARSGEIEQAPLPLTEVMNDLFEDQIESEKRMILETDQANTTQIEAMREFRKSEHRSGSHSKFHISHADFEIDEAAHTTSAYREEERSRLPLVILLASILIALSAVGVAAWKLTLGARMPLTTITEIMPPSTVAALGAQPTPPPAAPPPPTAIGQPPSPTPEPAATTPNRGDDNRRGSRDRGEKHGNSGRTSARELPVSPPAPPAAPAPAVPQFGSMQMSSVPPVQILLGGSSVGQTIKLRSASGRLVFGTGSNAKSDPFRVTVTYRVTGEQIIYVVDATPWAIVKDKNGAGIGKTPLSSPVQGAAGSTVLEFINPKEGRALRLTLRFSPP